MKWLATVDNGTSIETCPYFARTITLDATRYSVMVLLRRINELYYASVDTTPRVQKTLSLIYPNLKSQLGDRHYMLLRRSAEGSPPGL